MNKLKLFLLFATAFSLFACTPTQPQKAVKKSGYLKSEISQAELQNPNNYKRYYYTCKNYETGGESYLTTYFPLSRESRKPENFGIYFQLAGDKAEPFDHVENKTLNARGTRFEVIYRSYNPIHGSPIELVAREHSSIYYKTNNGARVAWLNCREG